VPDGVTITVDDALQGPLVQDVDAAVGDFVLKRGDGQYAYQLACAVDDLAMGITEVVRGADLLDSAPRQALLARLLGGTPPAFAHVPLVVASDGARLAKRAHGVTVTDHRRAGATPAFVLGLVTALLGLPSAAAPCDLVPAFDRAPLAGRREARLAP
jgi:glutamyl/glutaminyl-tRNA synthetase